MLPKERKKKPPTLRTKPKVKMGPIWDYTKGLTQSALTTWLSCREQFSLQYLDGWTPRSFSAPLEFGSMIHFMLQAHTGSSSPEKIARDVTKSYEATRSKTLDQGSYQDLQKALTSAQALFPLYAEYYAKDDAKLSWVEREHVFKVPHKFSIGKSCEHGDHDYQKIDLCGMRDGDYRNPKGGLGLFETKTKSTIDDLAIQSGLRADLQTMMYLHSMRIEYKEEPVEILYNVIRRPGLVLGKNESLQEYGLRIASDIKKRPEWYFRRYEVTVLPGDVDTFIKTTLDPVLRCFLQWWESIEENPTEGRWLSPYHYRSLPALMTRFGKAPLYDLMILGRTAGYFRRSSPFPELEESLITQN